MKIINDLLLIYWPLFISSLPSSTRSVVNSSSSRNCWKPSIESSLLPILKYVAKQNARIAIGKYTLNPSDIIEMTSIWPITWEEKREYIIHKENLQIYKLFKQHYLCIVCFQNMSLDNMRIHMNKSQEVKTHGRS